MTIHFDSEKTLEDMFMSNIEHFSNLLCAEHYKAIRQPKLGAYGMGDILLYKNVIKNDGQSIMVFHLLELKNTKLSHAHISQCARYKSFFDNLFEYCPYACEITIHLIGLKTFPDCNNDLCFLAQSIDWLEVYELDINPSKGVILNSASGWKVGDFTDRDYDDFNTLYLEDVI